MKWVNAKDRLPMPFVRVWVRTSLARQTTAYVKPSGEWVLMCAKLAAQKPTVISWRE